jgi:hypothetical protein
MKVANAAVLAVLALFALPAGVAAKPGYSVEAPQRQAEFKLPATNGFRVTVSAAEAQPKGRPSVYIIASKGRRESVTYFVTSLGGEEDVIDAKLPGVGRISVRFEPTKMTREAPADNCKGRPSLVRLGLFRGTIELHGEHGYTSVDRDSAPGTITNSFRQVCDQGGPGSHGADPGNSFHQETLFAGLRKSPERDYGFTASKVDLGPLFGGPTVFFSADATTRGTGFTAIHSVSASGGPAQISTPQPIGTPGDVTVTPPSPFHGSGLFHLDSPTSSSWTGDLGVELPGIGPVALAGPQFWSAFCAESSCTDTLPRGVRVFTIS